MPRRKEVDGELQILKALKDGSPKSMRELEKITGLNWNAIYYWLRNQDNKNNLVVRGCVEEIRVVDETSNRAQDMFKYRITEYGLRVCLPSAKAKKQPSNNI